MLHSKGKTTSGILGIGSYLPERSVSNDDLSEMMDTSDEWIRTRTGIGSRRRAAPQETTASLAAEAALRAVEDAGVEPSEIDLIIAGSMFPDFSYPGPGMVVQLRLGIDRTIPVLDIRQQCSGFVYSLSLADLYISSGQARHVLCVFSEKEFDHFKIDRQVGVIFGDGAGAAVVGPCAGERGTIITDLQGDGSGVPDLVMTSDSIVGLAAGEAAWPPELEKCREYWSERGFPPGQTKLPFWIGQEVFRNAVKRLVRSARDVLRAAGLAVEDVDHFFFHQANARINNKLSELLRIPEEKAPSNIERIGNTGAASIPILMDEERRAGRLRQGDLCVLSAFGAGYLWGTALLRF